MRIFLERRATAAIEAKKESAAIAAMMENEDAAGRSVLKERKGLQGLLERLARQVLPGRQGLPEKPDLRALLAQQGRQGLPA